MAHGSVPAFDNDRSPRRRSEEMVEYRPSVHRPPPPLGAFVRSCTCHAASQQTRPTPSDGKGRQFHPGTARLTPFKLIELLLRLEALRPGNV